MAIHQAQKETTWKQTGMSLEHSRQTCLVHQQTGTAHHAQQTDLTNRLHLTCSTNREKNNKGKTRGRHPSANRKRQPQQTSVMGKLDYTSRFVRVIPTLSPNQSSHNSIGHSGRYYMVLTASTSQQQTRISLCTSFFSLFLSLTTT